MFAFAVLFSFFYIQKHQRFNFSQYEVIVQYDPTSLIANYISDISDTGDISRVQK